MQINWLDCILLLPLLVGLVRGLMRGLISEIIAIVVVIVGVIGARYVGPQASQWLLQSFAWPQGVCDVVAYTLLFLTIAIILSILGRMLTKLIRAIHLGWANRIAGGLFGVCKYGIIVLVAVFALNKSNEAFHWLDDAPIVKSSVVYPQMVKLTNDLLLISGK